MSAADDALRPMRNSLEPSLMRDSLSNMPPAPKRRAFSVSDRGLYRGASSSALAARRAVSSAFSNVSRFVRSSSSGDHDAPIMAHESGGSLTDDPASHPPQITRGRSKSYTPTISTWKISSKLPQVPASFKALRRPRPRRPSTSLVPWNEGHVQYVSSSYAHHGEDAGAISSYYHIVADGISAPFAGQAPESVPAIRVSSAVIAQALVKAVEHALEDLTNRNKEPLDKAAFEQAVCDAIHAARMQCAVHKESRIATTLCVVYFDRWNSKLLCFTLGDSKCVVLRRGDLAFESTCTVREFNVPCVVNLAHPLEPNDYLVESFELAQDDVCLTFSDGIGDNVYKDDVLAAAEALENDSSTLQQICDALVAQSTLAGALPPSPSSSVTTTTSEDAATAEPADSLAEASASSSSSTTSEPESEQPTGEQQREEPSPEDPETCPTVLLRERLDSTSMDDDGHETEPPTTPPRDDDGRQHKPSSKRFYPFATAAAYEYRRRVLRQKAVAPPEVLADRNFQRHLRDSALLLDLHDGKSVMDRQVLISKAHRRPHYSLVQLHRMAQIRAKKPDDVTLLVTRFA